MAQWRERSPSTSVTCVHSWTQRHMWIEFVVGSLLCLENVFLRVLRFFSYPPKPAFDLI